jgi:hypothetical protein
VAGVRDTNQPSQFESLPYFRGESKDYFTQPSNLIFPRGGHSVYVHKLVVWIFRVKLIYRVNGKALGLGLLWSRLVVNDPYRRSCSKRSPLIPVGVFLLTLVPPRSTH